MIHGHINSYQSFAWSRISVIFRDFGEKILKFHGCFFISRPLHVLVWELVAFLARCLFCFSILYLVFCIFNLFLYLLDLHFLAAVRHIGEGVKACERACLGKFAGFEENKSAFLIFYAVVTRSLYQFAREAKFLSLAHSWCMHSPPLWPKTDFSL